MTAAFTSAACAISDAGHQGTARLPANLLYLVIYPWYWYYGRLVLEVRARFYPLHVRSSRAFTIWKSH
eukprot:6207931-Pleurochrysis_carterae.AAC.1